MLAVAVPAATSASAQTCPAGGITFNAAFSGGVIKIGSGAVSRNLNGTACGQLSLTGLSITGSTINASFTADAPAANVSFAAGSVTLFGLISAPDTTTIDSDLAGTASAAINMTTGASVVNQSLSQSISATVDLLGFYCTLGPFTPVLTTGPSGSLTGVPFTGTQNLTAGTSSLTGTVVANAFTVPAGKSSSTCPALIAGVQNLLLGLPLSAGKSSLQLNASLNVAGLPPI
jgi:hypothetical protein